LNRTSNFASKIKILRFPAIEPVKIADALGSRRTDTNRDLAATRSTCLPQLRDLCIEF